MEQKGGGRGVKSDEDTEWRGEATEWRKKHNTRTTFEERDVVVVSDLPEGVRHLPWKKGNPGDYTFTEALQQGE